MDISNPVSGIIYTDPDACKGCMSCIRACPSFGANVAVTKADGSAQIVPDDRHCIYCGACVGACTHKVRHFLDDSAGFFSALAAGKKISALIAPALLLNYPKEYGRILGWLKARGVSSLYSVSFGADIATWAYLKYIGETGNTGMVSQPCPSIVAYMEKQEPKLLDRLIPVQSPMMCTAIYLKKYMGVTDELAFISPCIGKKVEMESKRGKGMVRYNVTFAGLMAEIGKAGLSGQREARDEIEYGMGSIFPAPGGLRQNVEFYMGTDAFVAQAEGEMDVYEELSAMPKWMGEMSMKPLIVDALNCAKGCAFGPATERKENAGHMISLELHLLKKNVEKFLAAEAAKIGPAERLALLNEHFKDLRLEDFMCGYEASGAQATEVSLARLDAAYAELGKHDAAQRKIDCHSCGYRNCRDMAKAVALGINRSENCAEHTKQKLDEKQAFQSAAVQMVRDVNRHMHELDAETSRICGDTSSITDVASIAFELCGQMVEALAQLHADFEQTTVTDKEIVDIARNTNILSINASIEAAHSAAKGFAVIAGEVRNLAGKTMSAATKNQGNGRVIMETLARLSGHISDVSAKVSDIKDSVSQIDRNVGGITALSHSIVEKLDSLKTV